MANEILMMKVRQCLKDLNTLKHVFSKSEENEKKYAEIKVLVIDVLGELASDVPNKSKVDAACKNLKDIAQEYNDAGDNLDVKKAAGSFAAKVALLKTDDYGDFLVEILQDGKNEAIQYLLKEEQTEMSVNELEKEAWKAYFTNNNYDKALEYGKKAIEKGSLMSYYVLGMLYGNKSYGKHDATKSYQYYRQGAEKGDAVCQFQVYLYQCDGFGTPKNTIEAIQWLEKSAHSGYPLAMTELGKLYCQQSATKYPDAFRLFTKAAESGDDEAKVWIGVCYEKGYGVLRDVNRAKTIYQQEMNRGNKYAKKYYDLRLNEERRIAEEKRKREEERRRREEERRRKEEEEKRRKKNTGCGCICFFLLLGILWAGYEFWYKDYKRDQEAPRTFVYATNLFMRSSKDAESENNLIGKIPYGSELITYSNMNGWAEVKFNGKEGYVASDYLLGHDDFLLLNGIWGNEDAKEVVITSKCRMAIIHLLKKNGWKSGPNDWQIFTKAKEMKPNTVLYQALNDGYDDFSEFSFILTNHQTQKRKLVIYAFTKDETPVFRYMEDAPDKGDIKTITYSKRNQKYRVTYSGQGNAYIPKAEKKVETKEKTSQYVKNIKITDISFANVDFNDKVIATYGAQLYQDTKYVKAKMTYQRNTDAVQKFKYQIKIYKPDGTVMRGKSSPTGCSFEEEVELTKKEGYIYTSGWGNNDGNAYVPGVYKYEISHNGEILYAKTINIERRTIVTIDSKPSTEETSDEVHDIAERIAEFPGGMDAFKTYIQNKMEYPMIAIENGVQGRVVVSFIVEKDGSISNATVTRGVDPHLDKEALRIINAMPKWKPAIKGGNYVRFKTSLPINFKLN